METPAPNPEQAPLAVDDVPVDVEASWNAERHELHLVVRAFPVPNKPAKPTKPTRIERLLEKRQADRKP